MNSTRSSRRNSGSQRDLGLVFPACISRTTQRAAVTDRRSPAFQPALSYARSVSHLPGPSIGSTRTFSARPAVVACHNLAGGACFTGQLAKTPAAAMQAPDKEGLAAADCLCHPRDWQPASARESPHMAPWRRPLGRPKEASQQAAPPDQPQCDPGGAGTQSASAASCRTCRTRPGGRGAPPATHSDRAERRSQWGPYFRIIR